MTTGTAPGMILARAQPVDAAAPATWRPPDARRVLQLALATMWLLDAVLQFQPFMFTRSFGSATLATAAAGNPALVAHSISRAAAEIASHAGPANAAFCVIQLLIGLGIAWRPAAKVALSASIVWALGVWWLGEGLGGVLTSNLSPVSGAPGAAVLYAVAAILLWPSEGTPGAAPQRSVAERPLGAIPARLLWLTLWASLAYFALLAANRSADGLSTMIGGMAAGQPGWLRVLDLHTASALAGHGDAVSITLAVVLGLVAIGIFLPVRPARAALALAAGIALSTWVIGQAFGGIFQGTATDPSTGPVLFLLAAAYWPRGVSAHAGAVA